ncbi:FAD binding domain-containing protein [Defluviimonas sp. SAOS-178_SWC]|uniref:FAD binding domain-containing protein n=1 Tax=Defluviimonas sp. SAOS-178_SWC TaxID=3121287 RepID=UPI003221E35F
MLATSRGNAKVIAGGQSLGPMLNLRLARPNILIDISGIRSLTEARQEGDAVIFGACVTHASIEDGRVPDPTGGFMRRVARGIAYRAVRNRGTIAGSVVHADPSADWLTVLTTLDAVVNIAGTEGTRSVALSDFVIMPFTVDLREGEFVTGIRVAQRAENVRFGYFKFCRKAGEFASAMAGVVADGRTARGAIGATGAKPYVIADASQFLPVTDGTLAEAAQHVRNLGIADDAAADRANGVAFARALKQVAQ